MSARVSAAATFGSFVLLALIGFRDDSGLLVPAIILAAIGVVAARHARIQEADEILRAHGLRRLRIGRDRIYVPLQEGDE